MKLVHTLLCTAVAAASPLAGAATFTVTTLGDAGAGTLRDAIAQANANAGADTITFAPGACLRITPVTNVPWPAAGSSS